KINLWEKTIKTEMAKLLSGKNSRIGFESGSIQKRRSGTDDDCDTVFFQNLEGQPTKALLLHQIPRFTRDEVDQITELFKKKILPKVGAVFIVHNEFWEDAPIWIEAGWKESPVTVINPNTDNELRFYYLTTDTGNPTKPGVYGNYFQPDRKSTRLNSSHVKISYAVFCL